MIDRLKTLPPDDAVLDAGDAGLVFGVSKSTVLRWAAAGDIGYSAVGRKTLFTGQDLREYVARNHRAPNRLAEGVRIERARSGISRRGRKH